MALERTSSNLSKRKQPPFKPPRPTKVVEGTGSVTKPRGRPRKAPDSNAKEPAAKKSRPAPNRSGFKPATATIISSSEELDSEDQSDPAEESDQDDAGSVRESPVAGRVTSPEPEAPAIPPALLTKLLYENFEDKDMRISKEAMQVVRKYMETFVKEALARAAFEREDDGIGDGFLQVEDLEKLAPQLLLDF
ncbi:hypothetical protein M501DRAFT_1012862 [Patellaria atrata CBS 101060]|uniref:Centromere protein X n=1 Tax=Patellaria atrata CBS 101060 TaxID=1346257 RepID=A0A9P4SIX1_9PEZI|nr:hypothetical protein M501DRAFT_1012862 [Patellaria atrata CBS 101060]